MSLFLCLKKIEYFLFLLINLLLKSFDTSKFLKLKQGPIRTTIFFLIISCLTKYSIPLAAIFFNAPFQPEWRAQIYFLFLSKIKIGQQSAVKTPKAICLLLVINPSPEYILPIFFLLILMILLECIWLINLIFFLIFKFFRQILIFFFTFTFVSLRFKLQFNE